jgi:chromosome segregation ATPase
MNPKLAVALTTLNVAATAASITALVVANSERYEAKVECAATTARLAEAAKNVQNAETSMNAAYGMLKAIEKRVFDANQKWERFEHQKWYHQTMEDLAESNRRMKERLATTNDAKRPAAPSATGAKPTNSEHKSVLMDLQCSGVERTRTANEARAQSDVDRERRRLCDELKDLREAIRGGGRGTSE